MRLDVCSADEVPEGGAFHFEGPPSIAVFRTKGEWFASDAYCPHGDYSLAEGYLEPGPVIECSAHLAQFCLRTGAVLAPPADSELAVHRVSVEDGRVIVWTEE